MHAAGARRVGHTDVPDETGEISGLGVRAAAFVQIPGKAHRSGAASERWSGHRCHHRRQEQVCSFPNRDSRIHWGVYAKRCCRGDSRARDGVKRRALAVAESEQHVGKL